jgi:hypothetical protein
MHNITLICTVHSEIGKCNSDELYKIIDLINPEVIFEELTKDLFDKIYNENILEAEEILEIKCIKKYLQNHDIKNIPIDIEVDSNFSNEINFLFASLKKYNIYNEIEIEQKKMIAKEGFAYLNSENCSKLFEKQRIIEKKLLPFAGINKFKLNNIYKTFYEEQDKRENEMLHNIYNYSKENHYNQAVFLIGSAHRNSIIRKVAEYETKEKVELNWSQLNLAPC